MSWHGAGTPLKLSHGRNGPGLEEISGVLVHPQNVQIGVANKPYIQNECRKCVIYDTVPWLRQTPRISDTLPVESRHGVGLPLKLSHCRNESVLKEISDIHAFCRVAAVSLCTAEKLQASQQTSGGSKFHSARSLFSRAAGAAPPPSRCFSSPHTCAAELVSSCKRVYLRRVSSVVAVVFVSLICFRLSVVQAERREGRVRPR